MAEAVSERFRVSSDLLDAFLKTREEPIAIVLCSFPPIQASTMLALFLFVADEHAKL